MIESVDPKNVFELGEWERDIGAARGTRLGPGLGLERLGWRRRRVPHRAGRRAPRAQRLGGGAGALPRGLDDALPGASCRT